MIFITKFDKKNDQVLFKWIRRKNGCNSLIYLGKLLFQSFGVADIKVLVDSNLPCGISNLNALVYLSINSKAEKSNLSKHLTKSL